ncbi:DddA-like double-stranded DNA deaminase toxin [Lentzea chajnantorensis]
MDGSVDPDVEAVHAEWHRCQGEMRVLDGLLSDVLHTTRARLNAVAKDSVRTEVGTHRPTAETGRSETERSPTPVDQASGPPAVAPALADQLRRALPSPVDPIAEPGRKTHGQWIGPDGQARAIVSGKDEDSQAAGELLRSLGMPVRSITRASDVEMKLAARMVRDGIRHSVVFINNVPCRGRLSCDTLVPIMLPAGATLTVHGVNRDGTLFVKQYTGGARPWWR